MKKISLDEVKPYEAPGHFDVSVLRLSGKDETGAEKFWVGLSHFLPGVEPNLGLRRRRSTISSWTEKSRLRPRRKRLPWGHGTQSTSLPTKVDRY